MNRSSAIALLGAILVLPPVAAEAATQTMIGVVTHVSTTDLTVRDRSGQTIRFRSLPSFRNVFSKDGRSTYQMSALRPGTPVTVFYTRVLGVPHASKILINGSVRTLRG
jgi:hypothetical protein